MLDLTGMVFGKRTVLAFAYKRNSHYYWQVKCICGDIHLVTAHNLVRGKANQCAPCMRQEMYLHPPNLKPIPLGTRIGKRVVLEIVPIIGKKPHLRVRCDCGREDIVAKAALKSGSANQCKNCQAKEFGLRGIIHGQARKGKITSEFRIWSGMISRCTNKSDIRHWKWYGGRGIQVCDRWRNSFEAFFADMGPRPKGHTLDRFPNNDGNYEPGNCRWATPKEQIANQRKHGVIDVFTTEELFTELRRRKAI